MPLNQVKRAHQAKAQEQQQQLFKSYKREQVLLALKNLFRRIYLVVGKVQKKVIKLSFSCIHKVVVEWLWQAHPECKTPGRP